MGPRVVIAKQGEYGAALFTEEGFFALPAYPLETVRDPTGAGDSFAGGLMGYLDSQSGATDDATLRRAMTYGSTLASFWVEEFGCERAEQPHARRDRRALRAVQADDVDRVRPRDLTSIEPAALGEAVVGPRCTG